MMLLNCLKAVVFFLFNGCDVSVVCTGIVHWDLEVMKNQNNMSVLFLIFCEGLVSPFH